MHRCQAPHFNLHFRPGETLGPSETGSASARDVETHRVIDLSAGGMRIASNTRFEVGQNVICDFELSDQTPYTIAGQVVRTELESDQRS